MTAAGWSLKSVPDMDEEQFLRWQGLLESRTGIFISNQRKAFLQSSLIRRMREIDVDDYQAYYDRIVTAPGGAIEWAALVDRLTVQETRFFRDPAAFEYVEQYIKERAATYEKRRPLNIWSVGCASGEEAYSLAMLTHDVLSESKDEPAYTVTATDISTPVLAKARKGIYDERRASFVPDYYREKYLSSTDGKQFQVNDFLKKHICFAQINVLDLARVALKDLDVIYCQNLLIYFRRQRREEILNHLVERLAPGGVLVIGMGEMIEWKNPGLINADNGHVSAYIKRADV